MNRIAPIQYIAKNMRVDLHLIAGMVGERARVLDARGLEIDMAEVTLAVTNGLSVMQGDADSDLANYPDNAFDYVILSRTLQAVEKPREVLRQMLRIGTHAIVSFPNFGHWSLRLQLLLTGRMPMTNTWSRPWFETPNIHPCTIQDFFALCQADNYRIESWQAANDSGTQTPWRRSVMLANLFGEQGVFLLRKA